MICCGRAPNYQMPYYEDKIVITGSYTDADNFLEMIDPGYIYRKI